MKKEKLLSTRGREGLHKTFLTIILTLFLLPIIAAGQTVGDYRSAQSGDWSALATWEYFDGASWITPTGSEGYPGQLVPAGFVTIRNGHTIPLNVSPPQPIQGLLIIGVGPGNRSTLQMGNTNRTLITSYLFLSDFGQVFWNQNSRLYIDEDAVVIVQNEGGLYPEDVNNAMRLYFGDVWYAASRVTAGGTCTFAEVNSAEGILSAENFGLTSNSPIFVGQTLNLEVDIDDEDVIDFYTWSGVGPGGYAFGPVKTTTPEQDVDNITEPGTYAFTVIVELECGFGLDEIEVIVQEAPPVDCGNVDIGPLCEDDDPVILTGATPEGGEYSGPGVSMTNGDYVFDPSLAGADEHTITYTLGSSSCTFTITVNDLPLVTCPDDIDDVCIDDAPFALTGATPDGGSYSGDGVINGDFDPSVAGPGPHVIVYTYTDTNGCTNSCTFTITVNDLPLVTCPEDIDDVCIDDAPFALTGAAPEGGTYSGDGVINGDFDPSVAGPGPHVIVYTYTDTNGCTNSCTFTITVNDLPLVTCPDDIDDVCIDDAPFALTGAAPEGGTYSGDGVINGDFDPSVAGLGPHVIVYTYTDTNGCTNSCTFTITVNPLPSVTASSNSPVLVGETIELAGGPNGMESYNWTGPDGFTSTDQNPTIDNATLDMAGTYILVVRDSNQCENNASVEVLVFTDDPVPLPLKSWALLITAAMLIITVFVRFRNSFV